jgi:prepilin-type N-terminal cleavage/methylation domain-containing protein/prepilin-type processing-associated H-X9-DG protein
MELQKEKSAMPSSKTLRPRSVGKRLPRAFTLIELLVVVSIIALLIAILLPSLKKARDQAKAVQCGTNLRNVGQAIASYLTDSSGVYPASYVYPDQYDEWDTRSQDPLHPFGYQHWSHYLYEDGRIGDKAFICPSFDKGGAPATNPGQMEGGWEADQWDQNSLGPPGGPGDLRVEDRQASRMAFTANAAIIPRNKFTTDLSEGTRVNKFVSDTAIKRAGATILATEFFNNWRVIGILIDGSHTLSKSHRPVNVFQDPTGVGYNEYEVSIDTRVPAPFYYGNKLFPNSAEDYDFLPERQITARDTSILDYTSNESQINAVGRHHPGGDKVFGGTANFMFCDGHVERLLPLETLRKRYWGERYYSLTGPNGVRNYSLVRPR